MRDNKLRSLNICGLKVDDNFWNKYVKLVTKEIIPYQWRAINDKEPGAEKSHCIENFKIAAGLAEGDFEGFVFQDTDLAKWLEAVAFSLSYEKNEELESLADEAIELVERAQEENGYLDTYFTIKHPGMQFKNLKEGHELYTAGHFIEAAVAYYKVTGKDKLLNVMKRCADNICAVFHSKEYENAVPGHEEIELALFKLYEVTNDDKYLQMAYDFVNRRGNQPNYLMEENAKEDFIDVWNDINPYIEEYGQTHLPVREQTTAEGHAVRAVYLFSAMADLAFAYKDKELFDSCVRLFDNMVEKRMYITGGIGSSGTLERFTCDYDLPNDTNYSESCASIGLAMFARRMAQITGDGRYVETMEKALINTVLAGIAMDGKSFFYVNPLEVWPENCIPATDKNHVKPVRQKWFGCACCPPNIARTLASLGEYVVFEGKDELYLNMYVGGEYDSSFGKLVVKSEVPWKGCAQVKLMTEKPNVVIKLRVPAYGDNFVVLLNGVKQDAVVEKGYALVELVNGENILEVCFDMEARFVYSNAKLRANAGKCAVVKGPIVYCLEEIDNGSHLANIFVDTQSQLIEEYDEDVLAGTVKIKAHGKKMIVDSKSDLYVYTKPTFEEVELTYVPYCYWGNRVPGEMSVWNKYI